jgi:hypothetical protein
MQISLKRKFSVIFFFVFFYLKDFKIEKKINHICFVFVCGYDLEEFWMIYLLNVNFYEVVIET